MIVRLVLEVKPPPDGVPPEAGHTDEVVLGEIKTYLDGEFIEVTNWNDENCGAIQYAVDVKEIEKLED